MPKAKLKREKFQAGQIAPATGVYLVRHRTHRPAHEAILLKNETFPRCNQCGDSVRFQIIKALASVSDRTRT
jgi:hypothetical protein